MQVTNGDWFGGQAGRAAEPRGAVMTREAYSINTENRSSTALPEREAARAMLAAQRAVDHPIITRCTYSSPGLPSFAEGSPYLFPDNLDLFLRAVRDDV